MIRMHQIRLFAGTYDAPSESLVGWGEGYFLLIPLPVTLSLGGLLQGLKRIDALE